MNIEQLRDALERIRNQHPKSEGWSCKDIAAALKMDIAKARPLLKQAVAEGVLVPKPYYYTALDGATYKRTGLGLPTMRTGTKITKRS